MPSFPTLASKAALNSSHFSIFQATGIPQALHAEGSLSWGPCEVNLATGLHSDRGDALLQLARTCGPQTSVVGHLAHSLPLLGRLGLPPSSAISLAVRPRPAARSSLALQLGPCRLRGMLEQHGNQSAWTLAAEPGCPLLEVCMVGQRGSWGSGEASRAPASVQPEPGRLSPPRFSRPLPLFPKFSLQHSVPL